MKYTYLLIDLLTISIPLLRSFEPRIQFYKNWKECFTAIGITGLLFIIWDYYKTKYGVWGFNPKYYLGYTIMGLPLEELLFFFTVPYACIFIYESVCYFSKNMLNNNTSRYLTWGLGAVSIVTSFYTLHRVYTFTVLLIGGVVFPVASIALKGSFLNKFYISFAIALIPMLVVNGFLTALPVVIYNNNENLNIRLGTIPIEDFVYAGILLITNTAIYQWGKSAYKVSIKNYSQGK